MTAGNCIDYLCEFMLKSTSKNNQIIISSIKTALADESEKLTQIYETLIENVLVERSGYAWGLCKALLALAVIDLEKYNQSKYNAICRVSSSFPIQEQLTVILNNLFAGIQQNLTEKNKENFLKNFGVFKQIITRITL